MQLDELIFKVDSTELERVDKLIAELSTSLEGLDRKITSTASKQSMQDARAARAAKDNAKARLDNAKATEAEEKAEERKTKALEKSTAATGKAEKATKKQTEAADKVQKLIQTESDILENLAKGLSLGESKRIAYARSIGAVAEQERELINIQEQQRKFKSDPFDNSASGVAKLNKELTLLRDAYRMNEAGLDLTSKQTRELTKDKLRLIESAKLEGSSIMSVREQIRNLNSEYISTATALNTYASAEKQSIQSKKDIASATRMIANEDEKMAVALSQTNALMSKASTDLLVRYESGLRKMGLSQDEMTKKLDKYKTQLAAVQAEESKRHEAHLARALSPQLTDIAVSLYSGQAPLTVLLQQGGQIADLFRLSGVEAQNFGKAMREAFSSMIPVMATVATGMAQFAGSILVDVGRKFTSIAGQVTGITAVFELFQRKIVSGGEANFKYIGTMEKMGTVFSALAGGGIAIALTALVAFGAGVVKAINASDDLARAMFETDSQFKATHREVLNLASSMAEATNGSAAKFGQILGEMAKQGGLAAEDIKIFGAVAQDQMKYLGVSAEDVVKKYSEMAKKPVESLQKLAESTGMVSLATLQYVKDLVKLGDEQKAQEVAMKELARVQGEQVGQMKENLSGFAIAMIKIGGAISNFFSNAFDLVWKAADPTKKLTEQVNGLQNEYDRLSKVQNNSPARKAHLESLKAELEARKKELDAVQASANKLKEENDIRAKLAKDNAEAAAVTKEYGTALERAREKEQTATRAAEDAQKNYNDAKARGMLTAKEEEVALANITKLKHGEANARKKVQEEIDKENKKKDNGAAKQAAKDQEVYIDLLNKADGLSSKYNNTLEALQRQRASGAKTENEYIAAVEKLIQMQPFAVQQEKDMALALELNEKLLGKAEGKGAEYYKTLKQIGEASEMKMNDQFVFTAEDIQRMKDNLEKTTPAFKAQQKAIEDSAKAYNRYTLEAQKSLDNTILENEKLDDRQALLGLTSDEQEKLSKQQKIRNDLLAVELKMQRDILKIRNDPKLQSDPIAQLAAIKDVEYAAAEERKMLNRQVAIQAAEDYDKEFRKIKEGISESLVEALFNGGKAGSKKLREFIIAELRKPITIVINALVNTLFQPLGNVVGSLFGVGGSGGGSGVFSFLSMGKDIVSAITGGFASLSLSVSNTVAVGMANLSGTGLDGMLAANGAYGTAGVGGGIAGMAGTAASYGAGALGGIYGGRLIGNGYSLNGGSGNGTINAGTAVGAILGGPVGALIGGLLGGVVNRLFGKKLVGSGIEGVVGGATDFEGNTYERYKGGLFRRGGTDREKLDEPTRAAFAKTYSTFRDGVEGLASTLGFGEDALKDFTTTFKVELKGLSKEDAAKAIEAEFARISELMADTILGTKQYTKEGETQLEALTRLSVSLVTVNTALDTLGLKMYDTSLAGADMASMMVEAFGSIDNFKNATAAYYENYYSAEEKQATLTRQLTKQFEAMHLTIPKTREEFRKMVEGLDLTTEEGRKMYAFLIQISPVFAQITESTEDLAKAAAELKKQVADTRWSLENDLLRAQGNETEAVRREREKELEALRKLDPALAALKQEIWETEDAAKAAAEAEAKANKEKAEAERLAAEAEKARKEAITAAMNALQKAVAKEKEQLQERITAAKDSINVLQSLFDLIETSIKDLYNQVDSTSRMTYANARKIISGAVTTVQAGGSISDIANLDTAIKDAMSGLNPNDYSTQVEYDRERLRLADELKKLKENGKQELTVAQKELEALEAQVEKLDATLAYWQEQIDIANGTYTAVMSVEAAIAQLQSALIGAWSSGGGNTSSGTPGKGGGVLGGTETNTGGTTPTKPKNGVIGYDSEGRAHYADGSVGQARAGENIYNSTGNVTASGITQEQWEAIKNGGEPFGGYWMNGKYQSNGRYKWDESKGLYVPAFAKGGNYPGGMALVGEDGPEMINFNRGGHVSTASETAAMLGASSQRVQALETALIGMSKQLANIASNTKSAADTLRNCSPNGNAFQMELFQE